MNDSLDIKRVFGPLVRYSWLIIIMVLLGIRHGQNEARKMLRVYESRATVKLNDQYTALTKFLEHIEAFSIIGHFNVELMVMRSDRILQRAIEIIDIPVSYYRFEDDNWRDQYPREPFVVSGHAFIEDAKYIIEVVDDRHFRCQTPEGEMFVASFGERLDRYGVGEVSIQLNGEFQEWWQEGERFALKFNSMEGLMEDFGNGEDLLIRLQDEKVAIANFYTWDESPYRAADFANALAEAYLTDFNETKKRNARQSRLLLDSLVSEAILYVGEVENELLAYQSQNDLDRYAPVLSERLDQLGLLVSRETKLSLDNKDLSRLQKAFQSDTIHISPALTYDVIQYEPYIRGLRKLGAMTQTRNKLRNILADEHPELDRLEMQIGLLRFNIGMSIQHTLQTNEKKLARIQRESRRVERLINELPGTERDWIMLQRKLKDAEARLENLLEKQTEAAISDASDESFHTLLEPAIPASTFLKPNPKIRMGVTGLVFGLLTCAAIHLFLLLAGRIFRATDLAVYSERPVLISVQNHSIRPDRVSGDYINLAMKIQLDPEPSKLLGVLGATHRESNPNFVHHLATAFGALGHRVLVVDTDVYSAHLSRRWADSPSRGLQTMVQERLGFEAVCQTSPITKVDFLGLEAQKQSIPAGILHHQHLLAELERMRARYGYILLSLPVMKQGQEALPLFKRCDRCLFPVHQRQTARSALRHWERVWDLHPEGRADWVFVSHSRQSNTFYQLKS